MRRRRSYDTFGAIKPFVGFIVLIAVVGLVWMGVKRGNSSALSSSSPSPVAGASTEWKKYDVFDISYTFSYPSDWNVEIKDRNLTEDQFSYNIYVTKGPYRLIIGNPSFWEIKNCSFSDVSGSQVEKTIYKDKEPIDYYVLVMEESKEISPYYRRSLKPNIVNSSGEIGWNVCLSDRDNEYITSPSSYYGPDDKEVNTMDLIFASIVRKQ